MPHRAEALFLLAAALVALFMMTGASAPLWRVLPFGSLVQFPWRLLGLTMFILALLSGAGVWWLEQRSGGAREKKVSHPLPSSPAPLHRCSDRPGPFAYIAALAIVLGSFAYTRPELQPVRDIDESPLAVVEFETTYKDMRGMTAWSERKPAETDSPLLAQYLAGQPLQRAAIAAGDGTVLEQGSGAASAWARVDARSPVRLRFYSYYFPGWQATVDGRAVEIAADSPLGLIGLDLPPGEHDVKLRFGATPLRRAAGAISLAALATALVLYAFNGKPLIWAAGRRMV